ncbi:MAG TPA: hypothetical protein VK936_02365 [Longimicrobiales bacterium]|nr:hypothetical protein [Longimicrobiales bacterium]
MMRTTFVRPLLLLAMALTATACATRGDAAEHEQERSAPLRVENRSWSDMRVYVLTTAGQRTRLGTVNGSSTSTLRIPASIVSGGRELVFEVDPVGSRATATSFSIFVRPGETVTLTIPPQVR